MARRSKDWNEGLAKDLQDMVFAQAFLKASLEEGIPIQAALGKGASHNHMLAPQVFVQTQRFALGWLTQLRDEHIRTKNLGQRNIELTHFQDNSLQPERQACVLETELVAVSTEPPRAVREPEAALELQALADRRGGPRREPLTPRCSAESRASV